MILDRQKIESQQFSSFAFGFNFVSTDITVKKEDLVYPPVSFISELGGALGLFVGFSFLQIWDWMDVIVGKIKGLRYSFNK